MNKMHENVLTEILCQIFKVILACTLVERDRMHVLMQTFVSTFDTKWNLFDCAGY